MTDAPGQLLRYRSALERLTSAVVQSDTNSRYEAVAALLGAISDLIGSESEWLHAGSYYTVWAAIHDLVDVYGDPDTFDAVARESAQSWLAPPADEAAHVQWLSERKAWLTNYDQSHSVQYDRTARVVPSGRHRRLREVPLADSSALSRHDPQCSVGV